MSSEKHTYPVQSVVFVLHNGQEGHLNTGEHSELPGQAQHHCEHEAGFGRATDRRVGIQRHCAAHPVHIGVQAGGKTPWMTKGGKDLV